MAIKERKLIDNDISPPKNDYFLISKDGKWISSPLYGKKINGNQNYYVRTDGSDDNNGLTNSSIGAFRTIQKAIDVVSSTDVYQNNININVIAGTYNESLILKPYIGSTSTTSACNVNIIGDTVSPATVIVSSTTSCFYAQDAGRWNISGLKLESSTGSCLYTDGNSYINIGSCHFGVAASAHLVATNSSVITVTSAYHISGASPFHAYVYRKAIMYFYSSLAHTNTGGLSFTSFIYAFDGGVFNATSNTWATLKGGVAPVGTRYTANIKAIIDTGAGGSTYFPGSISGTSSNGSTYY